MTDERAVRLLAPDHAAFERAKKLVDALSDLRALPDDVITGRCAGSRGASYEIRVELDGTRARCSCPSRQRPCKHALALLLAHAREMDFQQGGADAWANTSGPVRSEAALPEPLKKALAAVESGDLDAAIEQLLGHWHRSRATRVGDLIERLSAAQRESRPSIDASNATARHKAWLARARDDHVGSMGRLLEMLTDGTIDQMAAKTGTVSRWAADPRIHTALAQILTKPPFSDTGKGRRVLTSAARMVLRIRDHRLRDLRLSFDPYQSLSEIYGDEVADIRDYLMEEMDRVHAAGQAEAETGPPLLGDEELRLCEQIESALERVRDRPAVPAVELLQRIYREPADDSLRGVYADLLMEAGDPRGEFINLQLSRHAGKKATRESKAREKELLADRGFGWLDGLGPVLKKGYRFERGFLHAGALKHTTLAPYFGLPVWSTLHDLDLGEWGTYGEAESIRLLASENVHPHTLRNASLRWLRQLDAHRNVALETVDLHLTFPWGAFRDLQLKNPVLPQLRRLQLESGGPALIAELGQTDLTRELRELEVKDNASLLGHWLQMCVEHRPLLTTLRLVDKPLQLTATRGEGILWSLAAKVGKQHGRVEPGLGNLAAALASLYPGGVIELSINLRARDVPEHIRGSLEASAQVSWA